MSNDDQSSGIGPDRSAPAPAAVSFVTTEHFTLQGARSSTVAEATGRATMFLGAVSGGLVALGLIASAGGVGAAFYAFGLVLLPTLAFVGLVTFDRVLQSGIEDFGYAHRIARLRGYYFQYAPTLVDHLASLPSDQRLQLQGLLPDGRRWQRLLTIAGMVTVITAVLAGSAAGLGGAVIFDHRLLPALVAGVLVAAAVLVWLLRIQAAAWNRVSAARLFTDE
jgi:hypothetical protein